MNNCVCFKQLCLHVYIKDKLCTDQLKVKFALLQDHFRKVVKPAYTNVYRDRGGLIGVVEFENQEDLDLAIRKLDDTEFRNPFERAYIRIRDESDHKARQRSRSRSRSRYPTAYMQKVAKL